eukprot:CAMPEP_0185904742 /NCGR_PEP_ID=MMETSP0196C-20130402/4022_1 /TAXON_ID=2932 /ORGANISM="Alexandrium fundyense, Strain CCMP1719" /LENGTH=60 /DNA_ID=CAMNT_0028624115 /DNA_START=78 /DNA_END=257 /DNA_ORIENTATION=-
MLIQPVEQLVGLAMTLRTRSNEFQADRFAAMGTVSAATPLLRAVDVDVLDGEVVRVEVLE